MENVAVDVCVSGQVQGVGFRYHCQEQARRLGVLGWVRNEDDGTVTGHFEGESGAVDGLVDWCRTGPTYARVDRVQVDDTSPTGSVDFRVDY